MPLVTYFAIEEIVSQKDELALKGCTNNFKRAQWGVNGTDILENFIL